MNERRFPWKAAVALAATALMVRQFVAAYRSRPQPGRRTALRPMHGDWHQVGGYRMFSRHGAPARTLSSAPVILVHGFGMSSDYLMPLAERLAEGHVVYAPELPGHGRSDTPVRALSISGLAQILVEWMDNAGINEAFLAAHSMGAQVAIEAVRRQPQRFGGLVLMGPTHDPRAGLAVHIWRMLMAAPFERLSLFRILAHDYLRMGWRLLPESRAMMHDPVAAKLGQLNLPVLLIKGERDAIVPVDWLVHLRQATHAWRILIIPGTGHVVHHSAPDAVANAIQGFLHQVERKIKSNGEDQQKAAKGDKSECHRRERARR